VPRCPSKYEMQQRQRNGEDMPHPMAGRGTIEASGTPNAAGPSGAVPNSAAPASL